MQRVGVLSLQGDFGRHLEALRRLSEQIQGVPIKTVEQLNSIDRLIIPGGESTTVGMLLESTGLGEAIKRSAEGIAIWGTCMGMIVLARQIEGSDQPTLGLLDIAVRRNAFGSQTSSFEDKVHAPEVGPDATGVFIRAPIVIATGEGVRPLATYAGQTVGVVQGRIMGTSFHPELTSNLDFHRFFLRL